MMHLFRSTLPRPLLLIPFLAACVSGAEPAAPPQARVQAPAPAPVAMVQAVPAPAPVVVRRPVTDFASLDRSIDAIGRAFPGDVGIAITDVHEGWTVEYDGDSLFPQQSVSKLWVAVTALDQVRSGKLSLTTPVTLTNADLVVFNQPLAARLARGPFTTTVEDLIDRAMTQSDNLANDKLLWTVGGPSVVRATLARLGVDQVRFGPGERLLQAQAAGVTWRDAYAGGRRFEAARNQLPLSVRQDALNRYLRDPIDGAAPAGITRALAKLKKGELLGPDLGERLLRIMGRTRTGPKRLKAGTPAGWLFAHKTGTGQVLGSLGTGYNDVAVVTAPDGKSYAVAVMIGSTRASIPERMAFMQSVTRTLGQWKTAQDYRTRFGG